MQEETFSREALLIGQSAVDRLARCHVAVFGVGGVGGYVVEALTRAGIGALDLIDADHVSLSNLNRQLIATWTPWGSSRWTYWLSALRGSIPRVR